ncbi:hypothetical protein [Cupriavidus campinensis]|uniref:Uncharacterized protein n=1 Tax=Cupriavidus campinensis TaxID=151783 RepID=A0AAE9HXZ2_9BURK|nr:hypothetical protein [Cupriavidus campinensis]URF02821.1 hypothetical protein M5D45_09580 [Cupriavidus campinensis]
MAALLYKILGYDESVTTCDCCGKSELKGTFGVERADGEILHFGSVCVTRHTGKADKAIRQEAKDAIAQRLRAANAELRIHPAVLADEVKMAELRRTGAPVGKSFMEAHRAEWIAAEAARAEIAAKHGFKPYQLGS